MQGCRRISDIRSMIISVVDKLRKYAQHFPLKSLNQGSVGGDRLGGLTDRLLEMGPVGLFVPIMFGLARVVCNG